LGNHEILDSDHGRRFNSDLGTSWTAHYVAISRTWISARTPGQNDRGAMIALVALEISKQGYYPAMWRILICYLNHAPASNLVCF
jgi:hypothetical protein